MKSVPIIKYLPLSARRGRDTERGVPPTSCIIPNASLQLQPPIQKITKNTENARTLQSTRTRPGPRPPRVPPTHHLGHLRQDGRAARQRRCRRRDPRHRRPLGRREPRRLQHGQGLRRALRRRTHQGRPPVAHPSRDPRNRGHRRRPGPRHHPRTHRHGPRRREGQERRRRLRLPHQRRTLRRALASTP